MMNINKQDYIKSLDLLAKANGSVKMLSVVESNERERLLDAHNLVNKFISHALTILNISNGTIVKDLPSFPKINFPDSVSIDVLTRAAMEAFLVFHWVFFTPKTKDETDYRYFSYKAAGMVEVLNILKGKSEHEKLHTDVRKKVDEIYEKLQINAIFNSLKKEQKDKILLRGEWRLMSWAKLAEDAGFGKVLASEMYRGLIGTSHSSSLSVAQMVRGLTNKEVDKYIQPSINFMVILVANMIEEYCQMFAEAQKVLDDSGASNIVRVFVNVGKKL
jgi:hypothetical protein